VANIQNEKLVVGRRPPPVGFHSSVRIQYSVTCYKIWDYLSW